MRFLAALAAAAFFMATAHPAAAQQSAQAGNQEMAAGFLTIPDRFWVQEGRPPMLNICIDQKETRGTFSNRYECTRHVPVTAYLDEVYPQAGLTLVSWEFKCLTAVMPVAGGTCEKVVVLYYR